MWKLLTEILAAVGEVPILGVCVHQMLVVGHLVRERLQTATGGRLK